MITSSRKPLTFESILASTTGASHLKANQPCEDYGLFLEDDGCIVFAVADGHGDASCPRSARGSKAVCEVACNELMTFAREAREAMYETDSGEAATWENKLFDPDCTEAVIRQIVSSIVGNWRDVILEDLETSPLSEQERIEASAYIDRYDRGERLEHIYGTTLIAGLATSGYLLLLQQGDGRCVLFSGSGEVSQPIPWDDSCFANVTTSMCDENAIDEFRFYVQYLQQNPVVACIAGTDGVEDSFYSLDQMDGFYRDLVIEAGETSVRESMDQLNKRLPEFSATGSGDDVTICGFIDHEAAKRVVDVLKLENENVGKKSEAARIKDRLNSMSGKLAYLKKRLVEAEALEASAAQSLNEVYAEYEQCVSDEEKVSTDKNVFLDGLSAQLSKWIKERVEDRLSESEKSLKTAQRDFQEASQQREAAFEKHSAYEAEYQSYQERLDEIMGLTKPANSLDRSDSIADDVSIEPSSGNGEQVNESPSGRLGMLWKKLKGNS